MAWRGCRPRVWVRLLVAVGVAVVVGGSEASAALPFNCLLSGHSVQCIYGYTGTEQTFTVPAGVTSVNAFAVGASGGDGYEYPGTGGLGGTASSVLTVAAGQTLYIEVGGEGQIGGTAGWNGGGTGGTAYYSNGGGGGGASDIRTESAAVTGSLSSRLLVAAGGGGGGGSNNSPSGGDGGAAGSAGSSNGTCAGGGGGGASLTAAGGAGSAGSCAGTAGMMGAPAAGGSGADGALSGNTGAGGGGGGGLYGGGGGGSGGGGPGSTGGGGGGGSSYAPAGTTGVDTTDVASVTITYTPGPPIAAVSAPASGGTYGLGASVSTTFSCSDDTGGPGAKSCDDSDGTNTTSGGTGHLDTSKAGTFTYTVTATSKDGQTGTASITYTVVAAPASTSAPAIAGTARAGQRLTCNPGNWTGTPLGYTYQWSLDGTPIVGASASQYTVATIDEGGTLTCTVTASNQVGIGSPATSPAVTVPVPHIPGCPPVAGTLSGTHIGRVRLGMTRAQARHAYTHSNSRGSAYKDFFCLTPRGVRVGYTSPKELRSLPARRQHSYRGRVIWISTSSPHFAIRGIRPGATVAAASKKLKLSKVFVVGKNDWYLAPAGRATAVLKVRHGVVEEIGIGERALTHGSRHAERVFLTSFG